MLSQCNEEYVLLSLTLSPVCFVYIYVLEIYLFFFQFEIEQCRLPKSIILRRTVPRLLLLWNSCVARYMPALDSILVYINRNIYLFSLSLSLPLPRLFLILLSFLSLCINRFLSPNVSALHPP